MANIAFVNPEYFYLLLLVLAIGIWYFLQRKKIQSNILFSDTSGIESVKTLRNRLIHLPFILKLLAGAFLILLWQDHNPLLVGRTVPQIESTSFFLWIFLGVC